MITVKATREGLIGHRCASGYVIDHRMPYVALPSVSALYRFVRVVNSKNGKSCHAIVLDVGPWNEHDDAYVHGGQRPLSERGISVSGHGANGSGIDLGERVWSALEMADNTEVSWEFVEAV